ncbi:MAG: transposase [Bacteroidales bacterium]|nr:transposase [Bacteroidales bacterium]
MGYREKHRRYYAKVTKLYFEDGLGYLRISKLIPVAATTVKNWCITFAEENGIKMEKRGRKVKKPELKAPESIGTPNDIKALQAEVARLQKELKREKLRADAYNTMIDIAESKFNIPIRKKAGAKR